MRDMERGKFEDREFEDKLRKKLVMRKLRWGREEDVEIVKSESKSKDGGDKVELRERKEIELRIEIEKKSKMEIIEGDEMEENDDK